MSNPGDDSGRPGPTTLPPGRDPAPSETIRLTSEQVMQYQAARQRQRVGSLLVIAGTSADIGKHAAVGEEPVTIGRVDEGLQLRDGNISRRHAQVARGEANSYIVRDLGSTNGTLLNGLRLEQVKPLEGGDQIVVGQTVVKFHFVDATEADYHDRVEKLVGTDDLTGMVAKRRFDSHLAEALRAARESERPLSAMMMDMDGLKAINDKHGHHVGASTISQVGPLIKQLINEAGGQACRWGGDEFSAFVPGDLERAKRVAERIRLAVGDGRYTCGEVAVSATISIGVAETGADTGGGQALLDAADAALYRAKAKGRNTVSD